MHDSRFWTSFRLAFLLLVFPLVAPVAADDFVRELQAAAIKNGQAAWGHWGPDRSHYTGWKTHSNRLIPVYTFGTRGAGSGVDLSVYTGANSAYRSAEALHRIYGRVPVDTLNPDAEYMDQTHLAAIQRAGLAAGKKHVFVVIFDGMDWQTTWAAAIYNRRCVDYRSGRGVGTHFQEYAAGGTSQYGFMVTSPHNEGTKINVDEQRVVNPGGTQPGGYNARKGGPNPWTPGDDALYLIGKAPLNSDGPGEHAYPDSAATATAICSGTKTYNDAINVDFAGRQVMTVAHEAQQQGLAIGVVTSVPISHATPACAYAHNVHRDDYQDLTRDLVGLRSIAHPETPLPGVDVLIGGGFGDEKRDAVDKGQGQNFVPGNVWITAADRSEIDSRSGGKYVVAIRSEGVDGHAHLAAKAIEAAEKRQRLFGFYGNAKAKGHLPFQTADGHYDPVPGAAKKAEAYQPADLSENPTLAEMTSAALIVLARSQKGFWLMVEAGDVDWANHDDNLDNSIGAVNSGDAAVKVITNWVESHSNWNESLMIVTADHGHYFFLDQPEVLTGQMTNDE